jgi:hypothetical protein
MPNMYLKAVLEFPFLKEFEGLWVVQDFLKTHLKYTSEQVRKRQAKASPIVWHIYLYSVMFSDFKFII